MRVRSLALCVALLVWGAAPFAGAVPVKGCTGVVAFDYGPTASTASFTLDPGSCEEGLGADSVHAVLTLTRVDNTALGPVSGAVASREVECSLSAVCAIDVTLSHDFVESAQYWASARYSSGGEDPLIWGRPSKGFDCLSGIAVTHCRPLPSPA